MSRTQVQAVCRCSCCVNIELKAEKLRKLAEELVEDIYNRDRVLTPHADNEIQKAIDELSIFDHSQQNDSFLGLDAPEYQYTGGSFHEVRGADGKTKLIHLS